MSYDVAVRDTPLKFAYRNYFGHPVNTAFEDFPFITIEYHDLKMVDEHLVTQLTNEHLDFIKFAVHLYMKNDPKDGRVTFTIDNSLLTQGWIPTQKDDKDKYRYYQYSLIENLLSLATQLIHCPHDELSKYFRKQHGKVTRDMTISYGSTIQNESSRSSFNSTTYYDTKAIPPEFVLPNPKEVDQLHAIPFTSEDYDMSDNTTMDVDSDDDNDSSLEQDELIDIEAGTGWNDPPDESFWTRQDNGWGIKVTLSNRPLIEIRSDKTAIDTTYQGPCSVEPGILAYGPFRSPTERNLPEEHDYRLFIHPTPNCDALDYFAYGGDRFRDGKAINVIKLPISTSVTTPDYGLSREHGNLIHQFGAYLSGDERYQAGVTIPDNLLVRGHLIPNQHDRHLHYCYPAVEQVIS